MLFMNRLEEIKLSYISNRCTQRVATDLLKNLKSKNPAVIKEIVLSLNQLYFDGLIEGDYSAEPELEQFGLDKLIEAGILTIGSFYDGSLEGRLDEARDIIFSAERNIKDYSSKERAKRRHLRGFEDDILNWGRELSKNELDINLIVPVASDGFEPAFLAASLRGLNPEEIIPLRFSRLSKGDSEAKKPKNFQYWDERLKGKKILITEGFSMDFHSIVKVRDYVKLQEPESITLSAVLPYKLNGFLPENELISNRVTIAYRK